MEWNQFAEDQKTLLEALTILNNRHRTIVAELAAKQAAEAKAAAKQAAEAKAAADAAAAQKKANRAPDKQKALAFAATVRTLKTPEATTAEGKAVMAEIAQKVENFAKWIETKACNL